VLALCARVFAHAQEQEGDLVHRFAVQGITDHSSAKQVQYAMMDQGNVHACDFVPECSCFKLAAPVAFTYDQLLSMLAIAGFELTGPVHVSDGRVLIPASPTDPQK
jgi:hypothetical protein